MSIELDTRFIKSFVSDEEIQRMEMPIALADSLLRQKRGAGSDYTDWLNWPDTISDDELQALKQAADQIQAQAEVLVTIGIGGSYIGARAANEFLHGVFPKEGQTEVVFAGNNLSGSYVQELIDYIGDRDFAINVISKSGTTTEPAIGFRIFKTQLEERYGQEAASQRIYVTTDGAKGTLHQEAIEAGYPSFVIPDGIGGRFSVLTAVGLLPIAVAGGDIRQLIAGAKSAMAELTSVHLEENPAYQYAAYRNLLFRKGFGTEILATFEPSMQYFGEWWQQLAGESEGKDHTGIYPSLVNFSTDLHSVGQYIQDGRRHLFETTLQTQSSNGDVLIPDTGDNQDELQYLAGKSLADINHQAVDGVMAAHQDGGVPGMVLSLPDQSEHSLGYGFYFFELAIAISGYLNGVNPFNQPGVEDYKKNIFALFNKPGYEELSQELSQRLDKD